jgi:hypothetical protein
MTQASRVERIRAHVVEFGGGEFSPAEVVDRLFVQRADWFELIKTLRMVFELGILELESIALAHAGWRRWCNHQIKNDPRCRKMAWQHLKSNGASSLIERDGDGFRVRFDTAGL